MKHILLFVWQLPQHILGLLLRCLCAGRCRAVKRKGAAVVFFIEHFWGGICLGAYIFIDYTLINDQRILTHEYGHFLQSRMLGPLYLLIVGVPSITMNIFCRILGPQSRFSARYYQRFPENWADKLGNMAEERKLF
ncbi:MAG: hypothetical protein LBQ77_07365 [Treponema sp.]|jgi:hypothetical protein|nr:hypothetical protein [Treponema sp.]